MSQIKNENLDATEPYFVILQGEYGELMLTTTSLVLAASQNEAAEFAEAETLASCGDRYDPVIALTEADVASILEAMRNSRSGAASKTH